MNRTIFTLFTLLSLCFVVAGCGEGHDHGITPAGGAAGGHAHQWKHNEVVAEFPGHKYALEIIDEKETTGKVTAFLTDAHCEPIEVDTKEIHLNFIVSGSPKTFTLSRLEQEAGEPAAFADTDMELATLLCEGWQGEAAALVEIGGTPYNAKLVKLSGHDGHDH